MISFFFLFFFFPLRISPNEKILHHRYFPWICIQSPNNRYWCLLQMALRIQTYHCYDIRFKDMQVLSVQNTDKTCAGLELRSVRITLCRLFLCSKSNVHSYLCRSPNRNSALSEICLGQIGIFVLDLHIILQEVFFSTKQFYNCTC